MVEPIWIGDRSVGPGCPCFVVAEAGVNHNGNINIACRLVEAAAKAGADAVKFQTFKSERLVTRSAPKADYQMETIGEEESQFEMIKRLELSAEAHNQLVDYCRDRGILFLSSPFDEESADLLEGLGVPAFKVPSGEITNLPYLSHVARKGKPMILATGMSNLAEVETAVQTIEEAGNPGMVLLHCVSNYPANPADVGLRAMETMAHAFGVPVGYSDHVLGNEVAMAAVSLGACVVEKHFTLDRNMPGPDHQASLEPDALTSLIEGIRVVESALGDGRKRPSESEAKIASVARKSLIAGRDVPAGTILTLEDIVMKRPGTGLRPDVLSFVIGRKTKRSIMKDSLIALEDLG